MRRLVDDDDVKNNRLIAITTTIINNLAPKFHYNITEHVFTFFHGFAFGLLTRFAKYTYIQNVYLKSSNHRYNILTDSTHFMARQNYKS